MSSLLLQYFFTGESINMWQIYSALATSVIAVLILCVILRECKKRLKCSFSYDTKHQQEANTNERIEIIEMRKVSTVRLMKVKWLILVMPLKMNPAVQAQSLVTLLIGQAIFIHITLW